MNDSWCKSLRYKGQNISGGAARNVRISMAGGMDTILNDIVTQAWNAATLAANKADGGKVIQMPKRKVS